MKQDKKIIGRWYLIQCYGDGSWQLARLTENGDFDTSIPDSQDSHHPPPKQWVLLPSPDELQANKDLIEGRLYWVQYHNKWYLAEWSAYGDFSVYNMDYQGWDRLEFQQWLLIPDLDNLL